MNSLWITAFKVSVHEDHHAPVVMSRIWYKFGLSYETPDQAGLSHALQYVLFKCNAKVSNGETSLILHYPSAEENAFTSD